MTVIHPDDHSRDLADLLDQLVAIDLELEPVCGVRGNGAPAEAITVSSSIAEACQVLRGSIADLRAILLRIDGLPYLSDEAKDAAGTGADHG